MGEMVRNGKTGFACIALVMAAIGLLLSGCNAGTTYGTGVSHEKQTISDMYNILSFKRKAPTIDYSARPDLIVPENTAALPEPVDSESTTSNPEWPETPEQRIARIRAQAGEIDPRTGDYSLEEQLRRKEGINIETYDAAGTFIPGKTDRDGNMSLNPGLDEKARAKVMQRKAELDGKVDGTRVTQRRFLTEPPVEYRTPYSSAPAGENAYSEEELKARKDEEEEQRIREAKEFGRAD